MTYDAKQFAEDIAIDKANLNEEFVQHASLFAHYAEMHSQAMRAEGKAKLQLEITESRLDKEIRDAAAAAGEKVTEKGISTTIVRNPDYVKAVYAYNDARASAVLLRDWLEAFRQRRDMLIQLGVAMREGMKADPQVREQVRANLERSFN